MVLSLSHASRALWSAWRASEPAKPAVAFSTRRTAAAGSANSIASSSLTPYASGIGVAAAAERPLAAASAASALPNQSTPRKTEELSGDSGGFYRPATQGEDNEWGIEWARVGEMSGCEGWRLQ